MPENTDQFVEEYLGRRKDKIAQRNAMKDMWRARQYQVMSSTPEQLPAIYGLDPTKAPAESLRNVANNLSDFAGGIVNFDHLTDTDLTNLGQKINEQVAVKRSDFTVQFEEAWARNRGEIPLAWWMQWAPEELRLIGGEQFKDIAEAVEERQYVMSQQQQYLDDLEAETDRRWNNQQHGRDFGNNFMLGLSRIFESEEKTYERWLAQDKLVDREEIRRQVELESQGRTDEIYEEDIQAWYKDYEEQLFTKYDAVREMQLGFGDEDVMSEDEVLARVQEDLDNRLFEVREALRGGADATEVLGTDSITTNFVEGGLAVVGWGIDKVVSAGTGVLHAADQITPGNGPYDWLKEASENDRDEAIAAVNAVWQGVDEDRLARDLTMPALRQTWEQLQTEQPERVNEYVRMAGMDPIMAFSFFVADQTEAPEAQEQMRGFVDALKAQDRARIDELREQDFRVSDQVLQGLAWWGNKVNWVATGLTYMVTDADMFDNQGVEQWVKYFQELPAHIDAAGGTPSGAVGLEGSLAGLTLDLTAGILIDPVTWFTGPRGSVRGVKVFSPAEAANLARSPVVTQFLDDAARTALSPSGGAAPLMHHLSWMDDVARGEFLHEVGFAPQLLPASPWRSTAGAATAAEIPVSFLRKITSETADDVGLLADDILTNGFKEYGEVTISRLSGEVKLTDGLKRLTAAELAEVTHMPVYLKIVDDFPGSGSAASPWSDLAAGRGMKLSGEVFDNVTRRDVLTQAGLLRNSGLKVKPLGEIDGLSVRSVSQSGTMFAWAENAAGDIVAALQTPASGGGSAAKAALAEKGVFSRFISVVEETAPDVVLRLSKSEKVSQSFADWATGWAKGKLADDLAVPGTKIDDLLGDAELRRPIADYGTGDVATRLDAVIPRDAMGLGANMERLQEITEASILRGAVPDGAARTFISRAWNTHIRDAIRTNKPGGWIQRYMTPQNIITRFELVGPGSLERIYDAAFRIWGDDTLKANQWTERLMDFERRSVAVNKAAYNKLASLRTLRHELDALEDLTGGGWDDSLRQVDNAALTAEQRAARAANQELYTSKLKDWDRQYALAHKEASALTDTRELAKIVEEMWDDYNRTHIATNPLWKSLVDKETGMVPWDDLQKGTKKRAVPESVGEGPRSFLSDDMQSIATELGIDGERLAKLMSNSINTKMSVHTPLSPLELMMARETGGAAWTRLTHHQLVASARESAFTLNMLWTVDKVFRASTAVTVSFDELLRIWHIRGPEGVMRWMNDRALMLKARSQAARHGKNPFKEGRQRGAQYLSPKAQERLRALDDYPTYLKQAERQFYDANGLGWDDIKPTDPGYIEAAQRWTGGMLQDSGFRAYLRGPEAFKEWFFGNDGTRLREASVLAKDSTGSIGTRVLQGADEAYQGWNTLFERVILKEARDAGVFDDILQDFKDTAARIDQSGGIASELPHRVFEHLGTVRGVRKHMKNNFGVQNLTEKFFDNLFMNPVNYRRGFLAEMTRQFERTRIENLFKAQNKRIMSDLEIERALGLEGLGGATRLGMKSAFQDLAIKQGYVPQSMVDDLIERAVQKELDNVLFTWDKGSRLGSQSRAIFPFGRPWADMMGYWGREVFRRPTMRGWVNESNFLGLKSLNDRGLIPVNPKPAAMMSRLAATDFTIDQGFAGEKEGGLLPGSTETDLSPIFFLPTGGDNPFGSMIPGLGFVPMQFMDMVIDRITDPVNDPEGYQDLIEEISDFIPMFRFQQGGLLSRIAGGGSLSTIASMTVDGLGLGDSSMGEATTYFGLTSNLGDITREINRTRQVSALLADPEELEALLSAETAEEVELLLTALASEADQRASGVHLTETLARWTIPAQNRYDTSISDIFDVWVDAAGQFPELQVRPSLQQADLEDDEIKRQYANDVRSAFFDLPQWKRDLLVSQQPSLAVNLVSSWEWTPTAVSANLPGSDKTYRTGGTNEDLARHQYYIENGYVRPLQPIERARRIVGMMFSAKESAAKEVYTQSAGAINEVIWESTVTPEYKAFLDSVAASDFGSRWDIRDGQEMWANWGSLEEEFEKWYAEAEGIDLESEEFENVRSLIKIPTAMKAWGISWPGINADEVSARFGGVQFFDFPSEVEELANGLGIELSSGMTGTQLYNEIQEIITEVESPLFSTVRASYDAYVTARSRPAEAARAELSKLANNPDMAEPWRQSMTEFLTYAGRVSERYMQEAGGIPLSEQQEVVDRFMSLQATSNTPLNWEKIWEDRYARTYGPLEWTPPEPKSPFDEDGSQHPYAVAPLIKTIIDGDSLVIQHESNGPMYGVRLLGVRAADFGSENELAQDHKDRLSDALQEAVRNGDTIWIVRDPDTFGTSTDNYGRLLAWLWIGDKPFYFQEDFRRNQTPSGGE